MTPARRQNAHQFDGLHHFDGGDKECGELLLELRLYFDSLPAGTTVQVTARDPGAYIDLPAWCRLVGHRLLERDHPTYLIKKKGNEP